MSSLLVRDVRPVDLDGAGRGGAAVDVRIDDGRITEVGPDVDPRGVDELLDAEGAYAAPGLWDQHVHLDQWALQHVRVDTSAARCVEDVLALVRDRISSPDDDSTSVVQGFGHRSPGWPRPGTAADLDAVAGDRPVVLISGDAHHGWLSTSALRRLGLPTGGGRGIVEEAEWFAAYARLDEVFGPHPRLLDGVGQAVDEALGLGVVGLVDVEFGGAWQWWPERAARGLARLRIRAATYAETLDDVVAAGLRTGDLLDDSGLVTMGPLKLITDGSLNTRTAYCCHAYVDRPTRGVLNIAPDQLATLLGRGHAAGLEAAVHAIGDAAAANALAAFEASGARGSVEHAQLLRPEDVADMARLGVRASVQPAHLLDDRDTTEVCWPDRSDRCFVLRELLDAGVTLALGSDAPVAPLDPWLAMAAAVHRSADDRAPWHPEQALTVREALAASVDGQRVRVGARGDLVLLDADPTTWQGDSAEVAGRLRGMRPLATVVAGHVAHRR